jgi:hypothetical protein
MFRVFGHDKVWVLDGGLPQWRASGYEVETSASGDAILKVMEASDVIEKVYRGQLVNLNLDIIFTPSLHMRTVVRVNSLLVTTLLRVC